MSTTKNTPKPLSEGRIVRFVLGTTLVHGSIIEDRGLLGAGGRRIYRVRVDHDPYDAEVFEMPEDELELVPDDEVGNVAISPSEIVDFLQRGGLLAILRTGAGLGNGQSCVWLCRDSVGNVTYTHAPERGIVGGAVVPVGALRGNRVLLPKKAEVLEFLRGFRLSTSEANAVLKTVGTARDPADEQRRRMEDAEKERIISPEIEMPIEALGGGMLSPERKTGLKRMTKRELQQLAQDVRGARTSQDAITMIVNAITASEDARRRAEEKKYDGISGPANVDMEL